MTEEEAEDFTNEIFKKFETETGNSIVYGDDADTVSTYLYEFESWLAKEIMLYGEVTPLGSLIKR